MKNTLPECSMKGIIDINCDLGESYGAFKIGNDEKIMPSITSANIACGFHAGDPVTMARTVSLAKKNDVAIGAHPGFPDIMGFGRREICLSPEEAKSYLIYQVGALRGFAESARMSLQHVKPHGALYNMAVEDEKLAKAMAQAIQILDSDLIVFAPPESALAQASAKIGLRVANEFFADRAYNSDGTLASRKESSSVIHDTERVVERAIRAIVEGTVLAVDGKAVSLGKVHTICVHGDNPAAVKLAGALRKDLTKKGIKVKPVKTFI
jgi:UPF0271 protein